MNQTCENCKFWTEIVVVNGKRSGKCELLDAAVTDGNDVMLFSCVPLDGARYRVVLTPPDFGCNKFEIGGPFSVRLAFNSFNVVHESRELVAMGSFGDAWPAERLARQLNRLWRERRTDEHAE